MTSLEVRSPALAADLRQTPALVIGADVSVSDRGYSLGTPACGTYVARDGMANLRAYRRDRLRAYRMGIVNCCGKKLPGCHRGGDRGPGSASFWHVAGTLLAV
jgi:hypothetical protein